MKNTVNNLSVVVPAYNEEQVVRPFYDILEKELKKLKLPSHEIIFVNDGSKDKTSEILAELEKNHEEVRAVDLTRNFGKEAALSAGLHQASGDCVVVLDADGQHPPEVIPKLLEAYADGYDMVAGMRTQNADEKAFKKFGNKIYYRLLKMMGGTYLQPRVTDFRVMSREVVDAFCALPERRRITRGLLDWMGYKTGYVEFEAPERLAGNATYSTKKLLMLAVDSILSSSRRPLSASIFLGGFITALSMLGLLFAVVEGYILNDPYNLQITGTAILALFIVFMVGLIFISQGILALYLARIYEEAQQRPLYIIRKTKREKS